MGNRTKPSGPLFRAFQILVLAVVVFFLGRYLYRLDWPRFWKELSGASPGKLAASMSLTVLGGLLVAWGWSFILRSLGSFVPHRAAVRIYFLSEMAKYIPGKIWTAVGRAVMLEKWSVPKTVTVSTVGIMLIVLAASGVVVAVASLPVWPSLEAAGIPTRFFPLLFLLLPAALVLLHPRVFDPVLNWFLRRIERIDVPVHLHYGRTVLLVLYWTGLWLIKGLATWILLAAIFPLPRIPPLPWLALSGVMAVSWIVGVVSPFTPAGLGIAELTIALLLPALFGLDASSSAVFAFLCRIWAVIADLTCVGLAAALGSCRFRGKR